MSYPVPDWDNVKRVVDTRFLNTLKKNLTAAQIFTPFRVRDLGVKSVQRWKIDEQPGAKISMEIPAFSPTSGKTSSYSVDLPIISKDGFMEERDRLAAAQVGLDTQDAAEKGYAMAVEINEYLYKGKAPGPATGLLNHADRLLLDNSGTKNWTIGNDMVKDLNEADALLADKEHVNEPRVLLMNPKDKDLFGSFFTSTSVQVREKLQAQGLNLASVQYDKVVAQNKAYLIAVSPDNFQAVTPYAGVGATEYMAEVGEFGKHLKYRWMTALAPWIHRGTCTVEVTFDRA